MAVCCLWLGDAEMNAGYEWRRTRLKMFGYLRWARHGFLSIIQRGMVCRTADKRMCRGGWEKKLNTGEDEFRLQG